MKPAIERTVVKCECPFCRTSYDVPKPMSGRTGECECCGRRFFLNGYKKKRNDIADNLGMDAECPFCYEKYSVYDSLFGKEGKCRKCGRAFIFTKTAEQKKKEFVNTAAMVIIFGGLGCLALYPIVRIILVICFDI